MSLTIKQKIKLALRRTGQATPDADTTIVEKWGIGSTVDKEIPKIIWVYWHDVEIQSPIVRICVQEMRDLHPDFTFHLLNKNTVKDFLPQFPVLKNDLPIANVSDLIRLMLLEKYGGIYLDASVLLFQSLDWMLDLQEKQQTEAVVYYTAENTLEITRPMIENWCIAATINAKFIRDWREEYEKCLQSENPNTYYELASLFNGVSYKVDKNYHKCYFACQTILEQSKDYALTLAQADKDAFLYALAVQNQWSDISQAEILLVNKKTKQLPRMTKLINTARNTVDTYINAGYFRKDSILGPFLR